MRNVNNTPDLLSIPAMLELHGYDAGVVAEFIESNLTQSWEYYDLVKSTLSKTDKDRSLMKLCLMQNLLCSIRAASFES
jgi:hypothetical protein